MTKTRILLGFSLVIGLYAPPQASAAVQYVRIDGISFDPARVEVLPGDSVAWENPTSIIHTVTHRSCLMGGPCAFDEEMEPDGWFAVDFAEPGIFLYQCRIHGFSAEVVVADAPGALPDLSIASLTAEPSTVLGAPNPTVTRLHVEVANEGTATAVAPEVRLEYRYRGRWHPIATEHLDPISPGTTGAFDALWDTSHLLGDFRVRAVADPAGTLVELREANNELEQIVSLVTIPGALPGLDLLDPLG